jgi:signal transduction histidine kinase
MRRWTWFFLGGVALALVLWATDGPASLSRWTSVIPLVAALLVWERIWSWTLGHPVWSERSWTVLALAAAALGISIAATHASIVFWLLGLVLVALFYVVLPLPAALAASAILSAHAGWEVRVASGAAPLPPAQLAGFLFSRTLLITFVGLFLRSVVRQAERRQRLVDELETARGETAAAERHAGVLEERQRLAREIHDTLAQGLSAIVVHLETAEQLLPADDSEVRTQVQRARAVARESLDETRRVMSALRPRLLERAELPEAMRRVGAEWGERIGVAIALTVTGAPTALHPEAEITLLRAVQESLANVRKHANAKRVTVTLSYMEDLVVLDVRDDGVGLSPDAAPAGSPSAMVRTSGEMTRFGLVAMRERVEQLGGWLTIESEPGEGTTVTVALPRLHTAEMPVPTATAR